MYLLQINSLCHFRPGLSPRNIPVTERRVGGEYQEKFSELYNFMDSCSNKVRDLCLKDIIHDSVVPGSNLQPCDPSHDDTSLMQGSQTSISQLSNMASSSGYQSFAYSQSSSSPVDSLLLLHHTENSNTNTTTTGNNMVSASSRENGNSLGNNNRASGGMRQVLQGSPLGTL